MPRSEAQKAADKRYAAKIKGKYERFIVHLKPEEYERICANIAASGMTKADFLRWAANKVLEENNE